MDKKRPKRSAGPPDARSEPLLQRHGSWKQRSSSVLWLKLNFTIKAARLQTLKRHKYQHLQEEALLKARGLLKNWEDGPVLLTEDLYSRARSEQEAQELLNYTPEALALRFSLRNHPDVVDAVKQLWSIELPRDEMGCIDQHGYASLFRRIGRSLEPDATKRRLRRMEKTIKEDWLRDSKGEPVMSFVNFFDSVFELADLWCETIDVDEYITFLRALASRVSTVRRAKRDPSNEDRRLLRPLKLIKAIDDEEESSSSEEELAPSEVDDDADLPSEGDSDGEEGEEEEEAPVPLPPAVAPTQSLGFIATKALQTLRAKTHLASAGPVQATDTPEAVAEERPRSRERRASIITLGDFGSGGFGGFGGLGGKEESPKTPTGLRGSSAKSRTTSAKGRSPLTSVRENGLANAADDAGINALVAMHRLRSAQPRVPVVLEDTGAPSGLPNSQMALNVGLPMTSFPHQKQQRPAKLFTGALGVPRATMGVGSLSLDGLPSSSGLNGALTSSAPQLVTGGLKSAAFGSVNTARAGSGGAKRSMLSSSSTKARAKKPVGIVFEDRAQSKGNNKRLAALSVNASGPAIGIQSVGNQSTKGVAPLEGASSEPQAAARQFVSGSGFDTAAGEMRDAAGALSGRKKTVVLQVNASLPFYTFDESASPAKRLLPPVLDDTGTRGWSGAPGGKARRQTSAGRAGQGPDFTGSYKTTAYLTGSLQAQILARTRWSVASSRNADERSAFQEATPLWFNFPGQGARPSTRRSTSKPPKRGKKLPLDDGYGEVTVSPWDTDFDHDHDDHDLARAVPREKHREKHQRATPRTPASPTPALAAPVPPIVVPDAGSSKLTQPQEEAEAECSTMEPPTLSVSSSMVPAEPPSCVSELTTLPQEYHELVLGGSAISSCKGLSRTASAPVEVAPPRPVQVPATRKVKILSREPQWMLHGASQPPPTLLEDGLEGRTVAGSSPRSIFAALASKRPRWDQDDEDAAGLCPRFAEHLEAHGDRAATAPSPLFKTDKRKPRCTCHEGQDDEEAAGDEQGARAHCSQHGMNNNNWEENDEDAEATPADADVEANAHVEDVTMILNATRGLVLRPGTMDRLAAKRARHKRHATRSEMMRRRCQYTFAKHLS
jgi:hypothetical protein